MTICTTWQCDQPAITLLTVRRPCGHAVSLNSGAHGPAVRDGTPPQFVQRQHACRTHVLERAGRAAPGPSTCPTCGVRQPVTTDALVHGTARFFGPPICGKISMGERVLLEPKSARRHATCPDCIELIHS